MPLLPSGCDAVEEMITFIEEQAWSARLGGGRLIGSTEILESLFGELKTVERQQSESGCRLGWVFLVLGAIVTRSTQEEICEGLEAIPWKAVEAWIQERLGPTVQSQRRTLQAILADP